MSNQKLHRLSILYCVAFFVILIIPSIALKFQVKSNESCEKRTILKRPDFHFQKDYLKQFGDYYEENYGLRSQITFLQAQIKLTIFNSSSNPDQVVIGKNGWLFYTSKSDLAYGSYSKSNLLTQKELFEYKKLHEKRKKELSLKNIQYLIAVCPDKSTIYSEYLPFQMKIQIEDTLSKIDQLVNYLIHQKSTIRLIDVRKELLANKQRQLYLKHDTHWNSLGAFYAYRAFLKKTTDVLHENPYSLADFDYSKGNLKGGDLLNMLGLCDKSNLSDQIPILTFKKKTSISDDKKYEGSYGKHNKYAPSKLKVLFFRDSYGQALIQYFSLHFKDSYFYWTDYDQKIVDQIKPDVVVVIKTERYI